ncbi:MAG TPA: type II toxin-antitoxin system prevent-host-death family antitoxin [Terriglobales bacterium]|nr:type II toxin-antitoxin system prevent-host-death family antitoxin [Terriglobales bacterium]
MKQIAAGKFKAHCLQLKDEVQARREEVVITKRGKPVAKLVPVVADPDPIFGFMRGKIRVNGDIVAPVLSLEEWGDLG